MTFGCILMGAVYSINNINELIRVIRLIGVIKYTSWIFNLRQKDT